jgi:very-short-patch-repair endonuclease/DNA polymerase III delta prime subunit
MELTTNLLTELQRRLKIGNRRGVHLNAIPANSRYKFDFTRLSYIDETLPDNFIKALLSEVPLKFRISWKDSVPDLNTLLEEDQAQLVRITKSFENLIHQTEAIESEKGINTFGFGYPILVRRDQIDGKLTVAPIVIWPLRIKRSKEFNTWDVQRNDDDSIYLNEILINHLHNDSSVVVESIPNDMLEDGLLCRDHLIETCVRILKAVNTSVAPDLKEILEEKLKSSTFIRDRKHYEKVIANSTNAVIEFGGLFSIFEVQKQNIINDYDELIGQESVSMDLGNLENHSFQPISSVEMDPSQQSILHSLQSKRNLLIQGPPGTGKSQTLSAVLINALENNKKTLVVCEKRTALEVLHNALVERGLSDHCVLIRDIEKDRRVVVDSVRERIEISNTRPKHSSSKRTLDVVISKTADLIESINRKHRKLGTQLLGERNWTDIVGVVLKQMKGIAHDFQLNVKHNQFSYSSNEYENLIGLLEKGQLLYSAFKPYESRPFLNFEKLTEQNSFLAEQAIHDSFYEYEAVLREIKKLETQYCAEYLSFRNAEIATHVETGKKLQEYINAVLRKHIGNPQFLDEKATSSILYQLATPFSKKKREVIRDRRQIQKAFQKLKTHYSGGFDLPTFEYSISLEDNLVEMAKLNGQIEEALSKFPAQLQDEFRAINLLKFSTEKYHTDALALLQEKVKALAKRIKEDSWTVRNVEPGVDGLVLSHLEAVVQEKKRYFEEDSRFAAELEWFIFYKGLSIGVKSIIDSLKDVEDWSRTFSVYYLNRLLLNFADGELPVNDRDHKELDSALSGVEKVQLKYIREFWREKQIEAKQRFEQQNFNLSVENLYNKRKSHRFKRLSLRQIAQYDADLFTTFFPIILTSPDVCCNLFKGKSGYFDIVMFDEASQLRIEDNLPAVLKGKQVIIAGDEHQMPPSNYFSKVFEGTIEDEDEVEEEEEIVVDREDIVLSCESLLDFGNELNFEKRHLDFHYRSRHPYLIDFSNYAFYNQRLKPLPSTLVYTPIKYIKVNGTFSDHINDAEAEMVLSIIENNIHRFPNGEYPTVGIATFNITQRNHIKSKILQRQKFDKYEEFNDKIQELEENGLFIKNLENIQGDERDVIILSTTYGPGKDGRFAQRFGPINHSKGYKLLNVIVTRAKYKVYVCSSVPEEAFMNYRDFLTTEGANNKRAAFYAYLAYSKAVSESDDELRIAILNGLEENSKRRSSFDITEFNEAESVFEEEVYQRLLDEFDKSKVILQYKVSEFRIDIVYDPKVAGVPKIAIECDGAKYHSSREAYLYDLHRQKILEGHGFVFHRIWSTNWWRNPEKEMRKLTEFIRGVESSHDHDVDDNSRGSCAFTDDIELAEHYVNRAAFTDSDWKREAIAVSTIEKQNEEEREVFEAKVKVGSKVTVRFFNTGKDIKVHIVDTAYRNDLTNGVQKITSKSPLAVSILGHGVGDIVKVGNLDNFVEIIEVEN